jgi:hypothetical protein
MIQITPGVPGFDHTLGNVCFSCDFFCLSA